MNKNILLIIFALAVIAVVAYYWVSVPKAPVQNVQGLEEAATAIADQELSGTDLVDLDAEFQAIDKELGGL